MPACEIGIIANPALHSYYSDILCFSECTFFNIEKFELSPSPPCELAVLDCDQSTEYGLFVLNELKKTYSSVPIIFVSIIGSEDIVRKVYRSGARDYFKRPFNEAEFIEVLEALLELKLFNRENRNAPEMKAPPENRKLPDRLLRAVEYIEQRYDKAEIYLEQVAAEACLSKYHFIRLFKDHFGVTPMQYVTQLRVEKAKSMMLDSSFTISHIAYAVGFNDVSEFNRYFKKSTGHTPTSFRTITSNPDTFSSLNHR